MKISIIIPLYNLETLIGKCIQSVIDQDLPPEEYEVLVVDDGSTDGSLAAARQAAQGQTNIQILTKPNQGLSHTRNYGTDRARGQYLLYLDADDYLSPNVLGRISEAMATGELDMLCLDLQGVDDHDRTIPIWCDGVSERNGTTLQSGRDFLLRESYLPMIQTYVFSREFVNHHHLRMRLRWQEDEEFTPRALYYAQRVQYLPIAAYNYLQRANSFIHTYTPESLGYLLQSMKSLYDFTSLIESEDPQIAQRLRWRIEEWVFRECKQAAIYKIENTRQVLEQYRQMGFLPIGTHRRFRIKHWLLDNYPDIFIFYYRHHK